MSTDIDTLERKVAEGRQKLDELWYKRNEAAGAGEGEEWKLRFQLARASLDNCSQIAEYIRTFDPAVANELEAKIKVATQDLDAASGPEMRLDVLHEWYRNDLAPLMNKAEQEAHLVAKMRSTSPPPV